MNNLTKTIVLLVSAFSLTAQGKELNQTVQAQPASYAVEARMSQENALQAAFEKYKTAAIKDNGLAVTQLVSSDSLTHYAHLKALALAPEDQPLDASIRFVDQIQVKILQRAIPADQLADMNAQDVLAFAYQQKMMGEDVEQSSRLDQITTVRDVALGRHIARDRPVGRGFREVTFQLIKENGNWQLDLLHSLDVMELQIHDLAKASNKSTREIADNIATAFIGKVSPEQVAEQAQKQYLTSPQTNTEPRLKKQALSSKETS